MIILKFSLTEEDYVNYYTYVNWKAKSSESVRKAFFVRQAIISICSIGVFIFLLESSNLFQSFGKQKYFILPTYVGLFILSFFRIKKRLNDQAKKFARNQKNKNIFREKEYTFSEKQVTIKDKVSTTDLQWEGFIRKEENEGYYFLFTNAVQALIIPKRILKNDEEKENLESLFLKGLSFDAEIAHLLLEK